MMAQFKYTEITTRSGNTKVCVFRKVKTMSPYKKRWLIQKILGAVLIVACVAGCCNMPEDCGGFIVGGLMGIVRVVCD
ncbi:hypothetical protein D7V90_07605 [bacterium 1xD42-87]|nr:hypothetical protein D7V90_07605 [bacterium 1xD42-87]